MDGAYDSDDPAASQAYQQTTGGQPSPGTQTAGRPAGSTPHADMRPPPLQKSPIDDEGMRLFESWLTEPVSPIPPPAAFQRTGTNSPSLTSRSWRRTAGAGHLTLQLLVAQALATPRAAHELRRRAVLTKP